MIQTRNLGLAAGVALVVVGLVAVGSPRLVAGITAPPQALLVVGVVAFVAALTAVRTRLSDRESGAKFPTPERRRAPPIPGDEFDDLLAALGPSRRVRDARERRAIRDRLDELAVAVLVRDGASAATARERLATGSWTDDPHAAAFFAEERGGELPLEDRFRTAFSAEPSGRRRARHAVDALARIATGDDR